MFRGVLALGVTAALTGDAVAQADVERTVAAGTIAAVVQPEPLSLQLGSLQGAGSGVVLVRRASGWERATRVVAEQNDGPAYRATLDNGVELRVEPDTSGVVRATASVGDGSPIRFAFATTPDERFFGLGERSHAVEFHGRQVRNRVTEGPFRPTDQFLFKSFTPPVAFNPRRDATYYPMPWVLSSRGYGVLLDSDADTTFDFGATQPGVWAAESPSGSLSMRVFDGPEPAGALARMTARLGRQPSIGASWVFGPWWQPHGDEAANLKQLRKAGAAGSVVQTYSHYLPCGMTAERRREERARVARFHAAGLAVTTYVNPMICTRHARFGDAAASGVLAKRAGGEPYVYKYAGSEQLQVGQFDFTNPDARGFFGALLAEPVQDGFDGWMEDFGEYSPEDAVNRDGTTGPESHNRYPTQYHAAAHAAVASSPRPLARFVRSGWTGTAASAPIVWGGDPSTDWGYDGLRSALRNGLSMGLSGVSLWGSDIGGFHSFSTPPTTPELLRRWIQLGFVSGVMRTEADGASASKVERAQIFDRDVLGVWRRYARLRTQLAPYLEAAQRQYDSTGLPIMRHLALAYPGDRHALERDDELLFGPDILAAPVLARGARKRAAYLPAGRWVDLWRSVRVTRGHDMRPGRARVLRGAGTVTVPAPQDEIPLFVRAGALVPMLDPDVETLTDYGKGVVHRSDRAGQLTVLGWPSGTSSAELAPGTTLTVADRGASIMMEMTGPRRPRRVVLRLSTAFLRRACARHPVRTIVMTGARQLVPTCP